MDNQYIYRKLESYIRNSRNTYNLKIMSGEEVLNRLERVLVKWRLECDSIELPYVEPSDVNKKVDVLMEYLGLEFEEKPSQLHVVSLKGDSDS